MPAVMKIDQDGLTSVGNDKSRSDGLIDGSMVTITNVSPGAENSLQFRSLPIEDDEVEDSLTDVNEDGTEWTFVPKAGVFGTYAMRLTVDGVVSDREFSIRSPGKGLRVPAVNSKSNPSASLLTLGAEESVRNAYIAQCVNNENIANHPHYAEGNFAGWFPDMEKLYAEVEHAGGELLSWVSSSTVAGLQHANHTFVMDNAGTRQVTLPGSDEAPFRIGTKIRLVRFGVGAVLFVASETSANTVNVIQRVSFESEVSVQYGVIEAVLLRSVLNGDAEDTWWVSGDLKASA
jgi:hypothetical protein